MKATRLMLLCEVRGLVVTRLNFDDDDGLVIDHRIAESAGMLEHEKVDVQVLSNGTRLACRVRFTDTSGELAVTGAVGQLIKPGDVISLTTSGWMKSKAAQKHEPRIVVVGEDNALSKKAS